LCISTTDVKSAATFTGGLVKRHYEDRTIQENIWPVGRRM
jgi:hypothetical protein